MEKVISHTLSEKWLKASVLGTIWASSEIVLGSFLHNLKIPFSGSILTIIALVILISVSYKWRENGIFWRAGIICALMKTMSPSAVIFGPMVAILAEAFILETSIRIFGRTILGYILGSIIAMSWILVQKILNFIIFYGFNIVELYESLMRYVQRQLFWEFDAVWMPIFILLSIYSVFGILAAIIGIKTGRRLVNSNLEKPLFPKKQTRENKRKKNLLEFNYSILWLVVDIVFMVLPLVLVNFMPFLYWFLFVTSIVTVWAIRYKRALRQLVRPKFWIFFVIITMVTAYVFTTINSTADNTIFDGLRIGVEMNLRAIILIMGFSVLGTELYNPRIRDFFRDSYLKQLPMAMELSLDTLPSMIASVPEFKSIAKNPVGVIFHIVSQAEHKFQEIKNTRAYTPRVYILSGEIGEGKTKQVQRIVANLKEQNVNVKGIFSQRVMKNGETIGYDVVDIHTQKSNSFLRLKDGSNNDTIGKFSILPEGLELGIQSLSETYNNNHGVVIIDEVGRLELNHKGWAGNLNSLINHPDHILLLVVRKDFIEAVTEKWNIRNYYLMDVYEKDYIEFCQFIKSKLIKEI